MILILKYLTETLKNETYSNYRLLYNETESYDHEKKCLLLMIR